jgi:hypothetical protein
MGLFHRLVNWRHAKKEEREAIEQAAEEMERAGEEVEPREGIGASIYPWMKGDA